MNVLTSLWRRIFFRVLKNSLIEKFSCTSRNFCKTKKPPINKKSLFTILFTTLLSCHFFDLHESGEPSNETLLKGPFVVIAAIHFVIILWKSGTKKSSPTKNSSKLIKKLSQRIIAQTWSYRVLLRLEWPWNLAFFTTVWQNWLKDTGHSGIKRGNNKFLLFCMAV